MTVEELITRLQKEPKDAVIVLIDADTGWNILKFNVLEANEDNEVVFAPCDYADMRQ